MTSTSGWSGSAVAQRVGEDVGDPARAEHDQQDARPMPADEAAHRERQELERQQVDDGSGRAGSARGRA